MKKCPNEFTCYRCKKSFHFINDETWNEEKALTEARENFGENFHLDAVRICHDCYKEVDPKNHPEKVLTAKNYLNKLAGEKNVK